MEFPAKHLNQGRKRVSQIPKQARTPLRDSTLPKKKKRDWQKKLPFGYD